MDKRIVLYDNAKGIGMILLVYGHLFEYGGIPFSIIFSFHMPLFLIISGILYATTFNKHFYGWEWTKTIIVRYLTPFCFFSILGGLFKFVMFQEIPNIHHIFGEFLWYIGSDELLTGSLWFLGQLAISMLFLPYIINWGINNYRKTCVLLSLLIISYLLLRIPNPLPFRLKSTCAVLFYVYLGYNLKDIIGIILYNIHIEKFFWLLLPIFLLLAILNKTVNIAVPVYNDLMVYVLCSVYGTFAILFISKKHLPSIIKYMGQNSLIFFSIHGVWIIAYVKLINKFWVQDFKPMINLPIPFILFGGIIIIIVSIITTWGIFPIYNKLYRTIKKCI